MRRSRAYAAGFPDGERRTKRGKATNRTPDDITMLGIDFIFLRDGDHARFSGVRESMGYSWKFLKECNDNHRVSEKTLRHILICADEIISNIIEHGHARETHIEH